MHVFGLIGYPLGHSFSKQYFNQKFETEGLEDCFFDLFPLEQIDHFPELLRKQASLRGLAVTIPYKESVMTYLHQVSDEVQKIGAVNCIEFRTDGLTGHNTDVIGFERSFVPLLQPHHHKALILGTGGSSRAVQYVLKKLGIGFLKVSRNPSGAEAIHYSAVDEKLLSEFPVIINCSPLGMSPNEQTKPGIAYDAITHGHYLFDLVYQPAETMFLTEGKQRGATVKNGYEMLLIQAEENWRIWRGDSY